MDLGRILNEYTFDKPAPSTPATASTTATPTPRTGKWSDEEERYACMLVRYFVAGSLDIRTGTSLRSFLAKKLRCSAMRVSTKLSMDVLGDLTIPKKLGQKRFFPMEGITEANEQRVAYELKYLEAAFLQKENLPVEIEVQTIEARQMTIASDGSDEDTDSPRRVGSWSEEEQSYACALINAFVRGVVNVAEGTTLRAFLADRLSSNPMRISKKLSTGKMGGMLIQKRLGSMVYRRAVHMEPEMVIRTEYHLEQVRLNCFATRPQPWHLLSPVPTQSPQVQTLTVPLPHHPVTCVYTPPPCLQLQTNARLLVGNASQPKTPGIPSSGSPIYTTMSPLPLGMKRKLPSLDLPSKPYLPSVIVWAAPTKKPRFTESTSVL